MLSESSYGKERRYLYMPVEMDYGPKKYRRRVVIRSNQSSLPSLTGGAISFVPETNHPLQRFQYDLQARKPIT